MPCRRFRIEGRVQGVWFRDSTRRQAELLGITGYARNMDDGSVEVMACGDERALDRLARWLHDGPPLAEVLSVESEPVDREPPERFLTG
ncbi:MAG: acylphosphatase [Gammaproteobacteria bacterium]